MASTAPLSAAAVDSVTVTNEKDTPIETLFQQLIQAIQQGNESLVKSLVSAHKPLITFRDTNGSSAFLHACASGNLSIAQTLLSAGAVPSDKNNYAYTALHMTSYHAHIALTKFLLSLPRSSGININAKTIYGITPLTMAVSQNAVTIVRELLHHGADPNSSSSPFSDEITVNGGLEKSDDRKWNVTETHSPSPLMVAAARASMIMTTMLVQAGADVNSQSKGTGWSALHYACAFSKPYAVGLAGSSSESEEGKSESRVDVVRGLVDFGADVYCKSWTNKTALNIAREAGDEAVVGFLSGIMKGGSLGSITSQPGRVMTRHVILDAVVGEDVSKVTKIVHQDKEAVNARDPVDDVTPLMVAAMKGNVEMMKVLLDAGAFIHARDHGGWSALLHAAYHNRQEAVRFLIEEGARVYVAKDSSPEQEQRLLSVSDNPDITSLLRDAITHDTAYDDIRSPESIGQLPDRRFKESWFSKLFTRRRSFSTTANTNPVPVTRSRSASVTISLSKSPSDTASPPPTNLTSSLFLSPSSTYVYSTSPHHNPSPRSRSHSLHIHQHPPPSNNNDQSHEPRHRRSMSQTVLPTSLSSLRDRNRVLQSSPSSVSIQSMYSMYSVTSVPSVSNGCRVSTSSTTMMTADKAAMNKGEEISGSGSRHRRQVSLTQSRMGGVEEEEVDKHAYVASLKNKDRA